MTKWELKTSVHVMREVGGTRTAHVQAKLPVDAKALSELTERHVNLQDMCDESLRAKDNSVSTLRTIDREIKALFGDPSQ